MRTVEPKLHAEKGSRKLPGPYGIKDTETEGVPAKVTTVPIRNLDSGRVRDCGGGGG